MSEKTIPTMGGADNPEAVYDARTLGAPKMVLFGFQHMFAMFGATILVPILTGLPVSTTLLFAGLGTLLFHFFSQGKVPAFLGSSFAFIAGYGVVAPKYNKEHKVQPLVAVVELADGVREKYDDAELTKKLRESLSQDIMPYMLPQRFIYRDEMPISQNGKVDIKQVIKEVNNA